MIATSQSPAAAETETQRAHPSVFEPVVFITAIILAVLGVVIGLELLTRVGVTPTTSVIGAMLAIGLARLPLAWLAPLRNIHRQNLLQTVISSATFGGANAVFLPIGVMWLVGRMDLLPAMFVGATLGMVIDASILYWLFDSPAYPASGAWPVGVATAECLIAGDRGGTRAQLLAAGGAAGAIGQALGIPMDVVGVCWIGNIAALSMFGVGLIVRAYARPLLGLDVQAMHVPHGVMIGAGLVAVIQIAIALGRRSGRKASRSATHEWTRFRSGISGGLALYLAAACIMAALAGLWSDLSPARLLLFVLFAAVAALVHDLVVGISAMHAGWFPAFATALIFLVLGMLMRFPAAALALLVGFTASTGPAFADLGYDFKTGWMIRGCGENPAAERNGRRQQFIAAMLGFLVAAGFVWLVHGRYFSRDLLPPADRVYAATIAAGASRELLTHLLIWAVPGALVQFAGGASRQIGVLFATGLLIDNGVAGWTALAALAVRRLLERRYGNDADAPMHILAGGFLAGSALTSFGAATVKSR